MHFSKIRLAVMVLIVTNVLWGAAFPIFKWSLQSVPPFTFVFLRFFPACILLLPFTYKNLIIQRKDIGKLVMLSIFGITLAISCFVFGLRLTESINAPIIGSSGPIFIILAALLFLKEKTKPKVIGGTLLSLLGVLLIIFQPLLQHGFRGSIVGNSFFLLATIGNVLHTIYMKKIMPGYRPVTIVFWSFLIGSIPLIPFVLHELTTSTFLYHVDAKSWIGILYGIIPASIIAHVFNAFAIKNLPASESGIFSYIDPLATVLVAIPLLHESLSSTYLLGSLLVFIGIFISEGRLHWHPVQLLKTLIVTI